MAESKKREMVGVKLTQLISLSNFIKIGILEFFARAFSRSMGYTSVPEIFLKFI